LAARIDQLLIDRDVYNYRFASSSTSALEAFEWTLGVNWYLNPNVKMQFDYAHTGFRYGAANGNDRPDESVLLSELQLQFQFVGRPRHLRNRAMSFGECSSAAAVTGRP
jgi:phosphate-selective porin OprO/OprP